jgi:hypothetical protein
LACSRCFAILSWQRYQHCRIGPVAKGARDLHVSIQGARGTDPECSDNPSLWKKGSRSQEDSVPGVEHRCSRKHRQREHPGMQPRRQSKTKELTHFVDGFHSARDCMTDLRVHSPRARTSYDAGLVRTGLYRLRSRGRFTKSFRFAKAATPKESAAKAQLPGSGTPLMLAINPWKLETRVITLTAP